MICHHSESTHCLTPFDCATKDVCKAKAFADKMVSSPEQHRYDVGPVCARCRHSGFQPADLPYWYLEPPTPEQGIRAMKETFEIKVCPVIRRRITASAGKQCPHYTLDPAKRMK